MKKFLFCASTISHINNFHIPYLKALRDKGYEVHVVANESVPVQWADKVFTLPFYKSLLSPKNIFAIFRACNLLRTQHYEKISTNTTLAGVIIRVAALFLKERPCFYHIVHGYLFNLDFGFKKCLYLFMEKIAAIVSDVVMVMNSEDYKIATKHKLYKRKLYYINGMGVNQSRLYASTNEEKLEKKKQMGFAVEDFLFVYAAEFSKRKNQRLLINAFAKCNMVNIHLLLAGDGKLINKCKHLSKQLKQTDRIHFLGYIEDVPALYNGCDVVVSTSLIEGLPFNIIEAIGCALPVIASNIKGHRELVEHGVNGLLYKNQNEQELIACLKTIYSFSCEQRSLYGKAGMEKSKEFWLIHVFDQIMNVYTESCETNNDMKSI